MAYNISCNALFEGCAFTASADTEEELLQLAAAHATEVHGVTELTPEIVEKVKGAIEQS